MLNAMLNIRMFCNTISLKGGVEVLAFQIKSDRKETENKTIRFPVPLVEQIEEVIKQNDVTFSGFVIQACEYALENMDTNESDTEKDTKTRGK